MKVIVISGPAGSGKSTVLESVGHNLKENGVPYSIASRDASAESIAQSLARTGVKHILIDECPESLMEQLDGILPHVTAYVVPSPALSDPLDLVATAGQVLQDVCHNASYEAGWWHHPASGLDLREVVRDPASDVQALLGGALVAQKLALIHSEASEALEGHRKGLMDEKLPHRPAVEVELADLVIRAGDLAGALGLDLGGAIAEKMAYNRNRPDHKLEAREAAGGKAY